MVITLVGLLIAALTAMDYRNREHERVTKLHALEVALVAKDRESEREALLFHARAELARATADLAMAQADAALVADVRDAIDLTAFDRK